MAIRIYYGYGIASYTFRVAAHEIETQITAGGELGFEARALQEFSCTKESPEHLMNGRLVLDSEGTENGRNYARYVEGPDHEAIESALTRSIEHEQIVTLEVSHLAAAYYMLRAASKEIEPEDIGWDIGHVDTSDASGRRMRECRAVVRGPEKVVWHVHLVENKDL